MHERFRSNAEIVLKEQADRDAGFCRRLANQQRLHRPERRLAHALAPALR